MYLKHVFSVPSGYFNYEHLLIHLYLKIHKTLNLNNFRILKM